MLREDQYSVTHYRPLHKYWATRNEWRAIFLLITHHSSLLLNHSRFRPQFFGQFGRAFFGVAASEELRLLCFQREVNLFDALVRWARGRIRGRNNLFNLLLLGGH